MAQAAAYEGMAEGEDLILNFAAGTGKTLAYVAPLVQRLWEWEEQYGRTPAGEVRAVIIVPTPELGQQVLELARNVARKSIRATIATGEHSWATQRSSTQSTCHLDHSTCRLASSPSIPTTEPPAMIPFIQAALAGRPMPPEDGGGH